VILPHDDPQAVHFVEDDALVCGYDRPSLGTDDPAGVTCAGCIEWAQNPIWRVEPGSPEWYTLSDDDKVKVAKAFDRRQREALGLPPLEHKPLPGSWP
jgi:hypothetical protein